ncbi:MAG: hypothetical protein ACKOHG_18275 [Planctomycetia bacterium]
MPALDESLRLVRLFARSDARRPASWLMLLAAVMVAADVSYAGVTSGMVALGAGAVLAVGAIGNLPLRACAALGSASRAPLVWLVERAAWPAVGLVLGAALAVPGPAPPAVAAATGLAAAAATVFAVRRRGVAAADAASLTLVIAGIAGAAGAIGAAQIAPFDGMLAWGCRWRWPRRSHCSVASAWSPHGLPARPSAPRRPELPQAPRHNDIEQFARSCHTICCRVRFSRRYKKELSS